jgi:hypothetical protein
MRQRSRLLPLFIYCSACGHLSKSVGAAPTPDQSGAPVVSSPLAAIGPSELEHANTSNLYDAIEQLRPAYLATRGSASIQGGPAAAIVVIVNGRVLGGLEELRRIDVRITRSVRRLNAADVYHMTGLSASSGGIEVLLGR